MARSWSPRVAAIGWYGEKALTDLKWHRNILTVPDRLSVPHAFRLATLHTVTSTSAADFVVVSCFYNGPRRRKMPAGAVSVPQGSFTWKLLSMQTLN